MDSYVGRTTRIRRRRAQDVADTTDAIRASCLHPFCSALVEVLMCSSVTSFIGSGLDTKRESLQASSVPAQSSSPSSIGRAHSDE